MNHISNDLIIFGNFSHLLLALLIKDGIIKKVARLIVRMHDIELMMMIKRHAFLVQ